MWSDIWSRSSNDKLFDREDIISGSSMAVCGDGGPDDTVGSRREKREVHLQECWVGVVYVGVSLIHFLTLCIMNDNGAEGRVQNIIKPDANADGRVVERCPRPGLGTDWQCVCPYGSVPEAKEYEAGTERNRQSERVNDLHPYHGKIGLPILFGNRSSRKKWTRPRTPTLLPVRSLIGICTSIPS